MHTKDDKIVDYFATRIPASRFMVNTPSALGGIGGSTGLMPSLTLGCGAIGGSATSENVGPMNLLDKRYIAYGIREIEEIRASVPACTDGVCTSGELDMSPASVDAIVQKIIERLREIDRYFFKF